MLCENFRRAASLASYTNFNCMSGSIGPGSAYGHKFDHLLDICNFGTEFSRRLGLLRRLTGKGIRQEIGVGKGGFRPKRTWRL